MRAAILAASVLAACLPWRAAAATLTVIVHGVRDARGHLRVGVCRRGEFLSEACARHAVVPARRGDVAASVAGIAPGRYAVAVYQDRDDSGRLKRNFLGIPREDVGFSGDPALGLGPPGFEGCAIAIGEADRAITVTLRHFGP